MKRLFLIIFLICHFTDFLHADTPVTIKSNVKDGATVQFCIINELTGKNEPFVDLKPGANITFNVRSATFLMDRENMIPFLVYSGETLTLEMGNDHLPVLKATNEQRNNELNFFLECYRKQRNAVWTYGLYRIGNQLSLYISNKYLDQTVTNAKLTLSKRKAFLSYYQSANNISSQFYRYINDYFRYLYDFDLLRPANYLGVYASDLPKNLTTHVVDEKIHINADAELSNIGFLKACQSLSTYECLGVSYKPEYFKLCYEQLSDNFTGRVRRYLLFNLLINNTAILPTGYDECLKRFINETNDEYSVYVNAHRSLENAYRDEAANKVEIIDITGKHLSFDQLVGMHKGELIYLDVWASWCVPCRRNIPFARKLEQKFAENNFKIVYLSVDEDRHKWEQAIQQEHLNEAECFLLDSEKTAAIRKRFQITGIPRYVLIGKDGNVITDEPIYPYQPHAEQIFSSYFH